jgi:SAM-dependent methyltransferase
MVRDADRWANVFKQGGAGGYQYPDENLVRLIKGSYADIPRSGRALDVGFAVGGSLIMLAQSGYEAYGLEVSQESLDAASKNAESAGVELNLGLLDSPALPYPDHFFDLVISWNAVYYFGHRKIVADALHDIHRILRPGGVLLMSVIHPSSSIVRLLSDDLGDGARKFDRRAPHDDRLGMEIFYDGTSSGWRKLLEDFGSVDEGYVESDLFSPARRNAWRMFLARK